MIAQVCAALHAGTRDLLPLATAEADRLRVRGRWTPTTAPWWSERLMPISSRRRCVKAICCPSSRLRGDTQHLVIRRGQTQHWTAGDGSLREGDVFPSCPLFSLADIPTRRSWWGIRPRLPLTNELRQDLGGGSHSATAAKYLAFWYLVRLFLR